MKVYISGSITNGGTLTDPADITANKERFKLVEKQLQGMGHEPVNPAVIQLETELEGELLWRAYMRACLALLLECDAIFMMRGWRLSQGAAFEAQVAAGLGMQLMGHPE